MVNGEIFEIRIGLVGSGKTLTQTELVVLPYLKEGIDVYCNYWINWAGIWTVDDDFPQGHFVQNFHYFEDINDVLHVRNCVVVFDEIQQVLDPRAYDKESLEVRRFFQQHRKHHVDIYGTTQHISLIAKSALIIIDRFIMCEKKYSTGIFSGINLPFISITETDMTLSEIRQLDSTYTFSSFSDDDDSDISFSVVDSHTYTFFKRRLLHFDLDKNKREFFHYYCPLCAFTVHDLDMSLSFDELSSLAPFCDRHKTQKLAVRDSSMYDTNYLVKPVVKTHIWRAFEPCGCGKLIPLTGSITPEELLKVSELESTPVDTLSLIRGAKRH